MANDKYSKIIDLPHPTSNKHPRMPLIDRAAQFAPFAALTGYDDAIDESARITDEFLEMSEDMKEDLDIKQRILMDMIDIHPNICVKYFVKDENKDGGIYKTVNGRLCAVDTCREELVFVDGARIKCRYIYSIEGDMFDEII